MKLAPLLVFSTSQDMGFASRVAESAGVNLGHVKFKRFEDGEIWIKYLDNLRGGDVYIVGSTNPPADNLLEILIMIDGAKRASVGRITAVIPYFGYARQDRKDQPRVPITARLMATLIERAGADRIITMDLHAAQIQGFFNIPVDHLYGSKALIPFIKTRIELENLVVVSPDVGGVRRARAYAKYLRSDGHIEIAIVDKRRPTQNMAEVMNIVGNVEGKNLLIVDDIIDTANSLINSAEALAKKNCKEIYACATHALLSGNAFAKVQQSSLKEIFVTNTLPRKSDLPRITQIDVAPVFGEAIKKSHLNESVSGLFLENKN